MTHKLIVALDNLSETQARQKIQDVLQAGEKYSNRILFKVNDLMTDIGLIGIKKLTTQSGARVMLDPKWHDISKTLSNNIQKLYDSGLSDSAEYVTIHASNGYEGCKAAVEKKKELGLQTKILAVTALTSLGEDVTQLVFDETPKHSVLKLAGEALRAGVDGIVCSPLEVDILREVYGGEFVIVNPGVRFSDGDLHDQKRILTPEKTIQNGSTDIVMGRPIIGSDDYSHSLEEIGAAINRFFDETEDIAYVGNTGKYEFDTALYSRDWKKLLSYIGAFYFRPEGGKYCRLASGLVSNAYINIGTTERNYLVVEKAASELAMQIREKDIIADVVMGAQMGSVRSSLYLAEKLGIEESVYTEKTGNDNELMKLKRHDIDLSGRKIVISEDIVTKGSTLRKMKSMVQEAGGEVVAIACVGNRHGTNEFDGVPLVSCYVPETFEMYWDENTPEDQRKDYPELPHGSVVSPKPKNEWDNLVTSMRK